MQVHGSVVEAGSEPGGTPPAPARALGRGGGRWWENSAPGEEEEVETA